MSRKLEDLDPKFLPLAKHLIDQCEKSFIRITIINTRRTESEQLRNIANGTSWVTHSKHQDGLAIDLCPTVLLTEKGWAPDSQLWQLMGHIGKGLGLRWGGDWKVRDLGHFEYVPL